MTQSMQESQAQPGTTEDTSAFATLLMQEFKPKTERAREAVESAVRTLAEQALAQTVLVSNDAISSIESIIAAIDAKLTAQVNLVIHQHQPLVQTLRLVLANPRDRVGRRSAKPPRSHLPHR